MNFPKIHSEVLKARLSPPPGRIRLVIDSDAKNEVDDQFAIAWALRSKDRFQLEAVYAAPFHAGCFAKLGVDEATFASANELNGASIDPSDGMLQSYEEIVKLFHLLGENPAGRVYKGSASYLPAPNQPVDSAAARHLVQLAMASDEPLYIAAIGAVTNIASAILLEPRIVEKIVVVWLAGQPLHFGHAIEFNMIQDYYASRLMFECGVPLVLIPCMGVSSLLVVSEAELREKLLNKSEIATYLANICLESFGNTSAAFDMLKMDREGYLLGMEDQPEEYFAQYKNRHVAWSRIIWDISVIAFLKNPGWITSVIASTPKLTPAFKWEPTTESKGQMRIATYCHRDMVFGDLFACLRG